MQDSARETVPWGPSIACSTPAAIEWVAQWKASNDPSGRLISSHNDSTSNNHANANGNGVAVANGNGIAVANGHGGAAANGKVNGAAEVALTVAV
jgi:asparagine synthase (glutamine-hydrolysing)